MTILELPKDALLALTDAQLEQLIGRLAEAEVAGHGAHVGEVRFSGSITAPDGGVDVRVDVQKTPFDSEYIPKPNTIFQSKKHSMPAGGITGEMRPNGNLSAVIGRQCDLAGAYVIVSLDDDCTEPMLNTRIQAMVAAVADHPNKDAIRLDFYDRFKLHQWLRQHPSVMLWVRNVLGQPLSGWQSYGRWSNVPNGMTDDLIMAAGVSVILPTHQHQRLTLEQAITPMRNLIATSNKAIRVAGLSGVGKTRFVQALFDETISEDALDRTSVVYTDTGADPDPSPNKRTRPTTLTLFATRSSISSSPTYRGHTPRWSNGPRSSGHRYGRKTQTCGPWAPGCFQRPSTAHPGWGWGWVTSGQDLGTLVLSRITNNS